MKLMSGVASTAPSLLGKARKNLLMAGTALVAIVGASSAAQAQCSGLTIGAGTPLEFNAGALTAAGAGTISSIVSTLNTVSTTFLTQSTAFVSAPGNPQPNQSGGGLWVRGIGGTVETDTRTNATDFSFVGTAVPGTVNCDTTVRQNFGGFQVGQDISRLNIGGLNFHLGVTAGYVDSRARDVSPGGTFNGDFQIPFAGIYSAWTFGNFFADAQVRWDFYSASLTDPVVNASGQDINARSVSFTGNAGYRFDVGNGWFIEPSVGVVYSSIDVDTINLAGTFPFAGPGLVPPMTLGIERFESVLGRASLRFGTNFVSGNVAWQPFATASVFHEFADDIHSTIQFNASERFTGGFFGAGVDATFNSNLSSSRIETYGQFALGIAGQIVGTGLLGYARVDYRVGEDIEGWNINAGLRYQFTPEGVVAPMVTKGPVLKAPMMAAAGPYNWGGFYVGGYVGANFGSTDWDRRDIPVALPDGIGVFSQLDVDYQGFIGGGQIGYNYQMGSLVAGLEFDAGGSNARGGKSCPAGVDSGSSNFFTCEAEQRWLASFTGRLGYAYDRALFYVKGGLAVGETDIQTVFNAGTQPVLIFAPAAFTDPVFGESKTRIGWTIGGGFEYGLTRNWSAKAEYMYYDLGSDGYSVNPGYLPDIYNTGPFTNQTIEVHTRGNIVKVGLNYRFTGAAPLVARY